MGHRVTLFASGDSKTSADLVAGCPAALRLAGAREPHAPHILMLERVYARAGAGGVGEFDLIHFHTDCLHFPVARRLSTPTVTTLHGRLDMPEIAPLFTE